MAPIVFYRMIGSPSCSAALLTAKALGLQLEMKMLDYMAKDHLKPEFVKINPLHSVPTIVDDGYALSESRAIQVYFATKYGKDDSLYPNDAKKRGVVEQRLYFGMGTLEKRMWDVYGPPFETGEPINKEKIPQMKEALEILDGYLSKSKWVACDHITIADHSLVASLGAFDAVGYDLTLHKNVTRWYKDCQKEMPGYKETNQTGIDEFRDYAKGTLAGKV